MAGYVGLTNIETVLLLLAAVQGVPVGLSKLATKLLLTEGNMMWQHLVFRQQWNTEALSQYL